ncbi:MAG: hypothetical protein IPP31_00005, partial [Chitinophagaceae bacterium]|nr:hypothetical protein [Chitinophagaceae bacterium]
MFLLVCASAVKGQLSQYQLNSSVLHFVDGLKLSGIDTICVYENYCIGCLYIRKRGEPICSSIRNYLPTYVIWRNNGTTYLTKKDACFDYPVMRVNGDRVFQFYYDNEKEIREFTLKPPAYSEIINGKEITHSEESDHSLFNEIRLYTNGDSVIKTIKLFYLSQKAGLNADNLNYLYNKYSKLIALNDQ